MSALLDRRPYPVAVGLLAIVILFVCTLALITNAVDPRQMDFISFWAAGKLVLSGTPAAVYDIEAHHAVQLTVAQFRAEMPFPYPPPFLFLVSPFALLPYGAAAILWVALGLSFFIFAAKRVFPHSGRLALAFPPVAVNGIIGQNGLVTGGLFMIALPMLERYPVRAGLLLGCLIVKPQLAILLPLAFAAGGYWRAFFGAAMSTLALLAASLVAFGADAFVAMFKLMPLYGSIAADGLVGWHKMATVYASARLAGAPAPVAWIAHALVATAAAFAVYKVWQGRADLGAKAAVLVAASMLVSPYLYVYDTTVLLLPILWLLQQGEDRRLLAALWCIPLVTVLQNWGFNGLINLAPLLPVILLILITRRIAAKAGSAAAPAPAFVSV